MVGAGAKDRNFCLEPESASEPNQNSSLGSRSRTYKLERGAGAESEPAEVGAAQPWSLHMFSLFSFETRAISEFLHTDF